MQTRIVRVNAGDDFLLRPAPITARCFGLAFCASCPGGGSSSINSLRSQILPINPTPNAMLEEDAVLGAKELFQKNWLFPHLMGSLAVAELNSSDGVIMRIQAYSNTAKHNTTRYRTRSKQGSCTFLFNSHPSMWGSLPLCDGAEVSSVLHPLPIYLYDMTFSTLSAIGVIAFDDALIELLNIGAIAMKIIPLEVVTIDVAIPVIIITIIVFDIHDNDLIILPH